MSKRPHNFQASALEELDDRLRAAADDAVRLREIIERSRVSIAATLEITSGMSERPHTSRAPACEDLVERLRGAADDAVRLHEIVESSDSASIAAAFAVLLAGGSASAPSGSKRRKRHFVFSTSTGMENDSISIAAKHDDTLEVPRDVAKQSRTLANLLAATDETRRNESISLQQFDASMLDAVFEWCEQHSGADVDHKDFSMQTNYANEFVRLKMTPWQAKFFDRYDAHKWELVVAANFLDVQYLYYSTCFVISESLRRCEWDEEVPESVPDDVLCDVLHFFSHFDINEEGPQQPRWKRVIEKNVNVLSMEVKTAYIKGDKVELSTDEVFDDLDSLCRHAVDERYAVPFLYIFHFREYQCAMIQAFLDQSFERLRVKCLYVSDFSTTSRETFRTCMSTLKKLAERLNFLEEVRLNLSCNMQALALAGEPDLLAFPQGVQNLHITVWMAGDTEAFSWFVEALYASSTRSLFIHLCTELTDPLSVLSQVYEKFASDGEIVPLQVTARVPRSTLVGLQQFVVSRGFSQMTDGCAFEYEKKRGNDWKIAVKKDNDEFAIAIEIKKVDE